ncbi:MAG: hypothetical protein EA360_02345 [Balneolaceae bacterium]|nr:MAG: hypothetical protein EA360_02345 [Balneolaceae bacterium]
MNRKRIFLKPILITIGLLIIPFFGNIYVDGWNWNWTAFAFFGIVFLGAGLAYELAGKNFKTGVITGFVFGGFIAAGLIAVLRYMNPDEDVAGVVLAAFLFSGLFFAVIGYFIHSRFIKCSNL